MPKTRHSGTSASRLHKRAPAGSPSPFAELAHQLALVVIAGKTVRFASPLAERLLGYPRGGLTGAQAWPILAPEVRPKPLTRPLGRGKHRRSPWNLEAQGKRKNGKRIWLDLRCISSEWEGRPALLVLLTDISLRKRSEEAFREAQASLLASQQLLDSVFEAMPGRMFITDRLGQYLRVNAEYAQALNVKPDQLIGKPHAQYAPRLGVPGSVVRREERQLYATGRPIVIARRAHRSGGAQETWYQTTKVPLRGADKAIIGQLVQMTDITQWHKTQVELRTNQQLLQAVFDAVPERLFAKDRNGRYLKINQAQANAFGVTPEQALSMSTADFGRRVGGDYKKVLAEDAEIMRTGKALDQPEILRKQVDGSERWYRLIKVPLRDEDGNTAGIVGLGVDITERRNIEFALRRSEELMQTVFDALPVSIFAKDLAGQYIKVNRTQAHNYGLEPSDMEGQDWEKLARRIQGDIEVARAQDRAVTDSGERIEVPEQLFHVWNQGPRWSRVIKVPLRDSSGTITGLVGLAIDVTERRNAEEALKAQQRQLRTAFDALPIRLTVKDREGRFLVLNRAHTSATGHPESEYLGKTIYEIPFVPRERQDLYTMAEHEAMRTRRPVEVSDLEMPNAGGQDAITRMLKVPILDDRGQPEGVVSLWEDITERRRAEKEIQRNRRLLQTVFDAIPVELTVKDRSLRYVIVNRRHTAQFGIPERDLVGRTTEESGFLSPGLAERVRSADQEVLDSKRLVEIPAEPVTVKGAPRVHRMLKVPLLDEEGNAEGVVTMSEDITDKVSAENELRRNQRLLRIIFDIIPHHLYVRDKEGRYVMANAALGKFFGVTPDRFIGKTLQFLNLPIKIADRWMREDREIIATGREIHSGDQLVPDASGQDAWLRSVKLPLRDDDGRLVGVLGLGENVTARKQTELALRENQHILESAQAVGHIGSWSATLGETGSLRWSDEVFRIYRIPKEGFDGRIDTVQARILSEDRPKFRKALTEALRNGSYYDNEHRIVTSDGAIRWVHERADIQRDEDGKAVRLVGFVQDTTERKEAEAALLTQQRLLQAVFDTIPQEIFVKDPSSRYVLVNSNFARFYGLAPHQLLGMPSSELPNVSDDLSDTWQKQDTDILRTGTPVNVPELRNITVDGREVWFNLRKFPWRDAENRIIGVVGVREDITARRHNEELMRANRRLLRTVLDTIPHLVYVKDTSSRFIMVNQSMADVYGVSPELMAGTHTLDLPDALPEQRAELLEADRQVIESGMPIYRSEVPLYEGTRGTRWYSMTRLPLRSDDGKVVGIVGMSEDITDRRMAEQELQTNRRLLRAVFDAVPFWLMVRDTHGHATLANRYMADFYGVEPDDFLGKTMEDDPYLKPAEKEAMQRILAEVNRTQLPVSMAELAVTVPSGRLRLMRMVVIPLFDHEGKREGSLILAEDVTDRKRSEQALLQAQKMESLGILAGGIAHDFNNLLVAILGNASLALLKLKEGKDGKEELLQIELAGQRAAELCRQMLAYSGRGPLEMQSVDVNQLVREMTQLLKVSLPKSVAISFRLAEQLPAIQGDPTQIRQVVMNLVINAGEAIGDKQGVITLTTGTQEIDADYLVSCQSTPDAKPGSFVFFEVSDSGHGMSRETLSRIFDPFFTTKFTGRGLGLASVIGIIRGHRGALRVYSEEGVGSAFRVLIPVAGEFTRTVEPETASRAWTQGGVILVVDDEAEIRTVAEKMLVQLGFEVVLGAGGQEALERLRSMPVLPRAALIDLTMPGMAGEDVVREMRRMHDLPVLIMSGYSQHDVQARFVGRKNTEFLQKPFTLSTLHAKMRSLLGDPENG